MKKCINLSIGKTTITKEPDYDADTSYLGEYTDKLTENIIVRKFEKFYQDLTEEELDNIPERSNEYRGFKPQIRNYAMTPDNPDDETKKYCLQDYQIMEDLNNQQWGYCAIIVKTSINTDMGLSDIIINSLCGIEDHWNKDSMSYIEKDVIPDLLYENKRELLKMGFSESEIDESFSNAEKEVV